MARKNNSSIVTKFRYTHVLLKIKLNPKCSPLIKIEKWANANVRQLADPHLKPLKFQESQLVSVKTYLDVDHEVGAKTYGYIKPSHINTGLCYMTSQVTGTAFSGQSSLQLTAPIVSMSI